MWLALLVGLGIGSALNVCADRLPRSGSAKLWRPYRAGRWGVLLALSAGLCVYLQLVHGWSSALVIQAAYCSLLLLIAVIDLEHRLVPNTLVVCGLALVFLFSAWQPALGLREATWGAVLGGGIFALLAVGRRNALGMGDVKLALLIGMMTGFPWVLQALTIGILLGGVAATLLLLTKMVQPKEYMPYAPYLVAGCIVTLLYGQAIAGWYGSLIGGGR